MKRIFYISIFMLGLLTSCNSEENDKLKTITSECEVPFQTYVNEYGQAQLLQINDTLWQTRFTSNDGFVFDTLLNSKEDGCNVRFRDSSAMFLPCGGGGINFSNDELFVTEFSSFALLGSLTKIKELYEKSFYRTGEEISFQADVYNDKDGYKVNGMYVEDRLKMMKGFYKVTGSVRKEKYPLAYYSTDESPQGKLGNDTTKVFYRLILENPTFELPAPFVYEGTKLNNYYDGASIIWDWADSESYKLEGHEPWPENEIGEKIKVEGYLSQGFYGSVLKNWTIIE